MRKLLGLGLLAFGSLFLIALPLAVAWLGSRYTVGVSSVSVVAVPVIGFCCALIGVGLVSLTRPAAEPLPSSDRQAAAVAASQA